MRCLINREEVEVADKNAEEEEEEGPFLPPPPLLSGSTLRGWRRKTSRGENVRSVNQNTTEGGVGGNLAAL